MYGIPQEGRIAHDALVKHLDTYGYHPSIRTPGLLRQNSQPINFSLVVDNFGVKCSGKDHALHLKAKLKTKYKVTTDWERKLCIGIALKWDHEKGTVQLQLQDMYAQHYMLYNTRNQNNCRTHHTPEHNPFTERRIRCYQKNHQMRNWMKI